MGDESRSRDHERDREHSHHRHRHRHRDNDNDERHHRKKRRREDDEDRERSHRHRSHHRSHKSRDREESRENKSIEPMDEDGKEDKDEESKIERGSWLTGGSGDKSDPFDSFLGGQRKKKKTVEKPKPEGLALSSREINTSLLNPPSPSPDPAEEEEEKYTPPAYTIGDAGSSWRMMKLKNLRAAAKDAMRPIEEVAVERMGSLRAYDEAREEEKELERRNLDRKGQGVMKVKVTGELYLQRLAKQQQKAQREQERNRPQNPITTTTTTGDKPITQSDLNKLRATLLRAEMTNSPAVASLAQEYAAAVEKFNTQPTATEIIALPSSHSTLLPHLSREQSKSSVDLTIEDMVKEERASKRTHTVDRIARDRRFKDDLDYLDENAERLAEVGKRREVDLKSMSIAEYKKQERIVANCPLCYKDDGRMPLAPVVSLGTRAYLSLPTEPELTKDGAMIVPLRHAKNLAECDDDEWEEIRVSTPPVLWFTYTRIL